MISISKQAFDKAETILKNLAAARLTAQGCEEAHNQVDLLAKALAEGEEPNLILACKPLEALTVRKRGFYKTWKYGTREGEQKTPAPEEVLLLINKTIHSLDHIPNKPGLSMEPKQELKNEHD